MDTTKSTTDAIAERISFALKQHMDATGKSQRQVAEDLGVHQTMVSQYLRKEKRPGLDKLAAIILLTKHDAGQILGVN